MNSNRTSKETEKKRWYMTPPFILMAILGVLVLSLASSPKQSNRLYIVAIDISGSTDAMRGDQLHDVTLMRKAALAENAQLEIWYYDQDACMIYGPKVPSDSRAVRLAKQKFLIPGTIRKRGTRPEKLVCNLITELTKFPGRDVRMLICTDGDNDYPADKALIQQDTAALSKFSACSIAVLGIHKENVALWKSIASLGRSDSRVFLASGDDDSGHVVGQLLH